MSIAFASAVTILSVLLQIPSPAFGFGEDVRDAPPLSASGDWKTDGKLQRSSQQWDLDLVRDGDTVTGTIEVSDSPLLGIGNVQGRVRGTRISGRILDELGEPAARFTGIITRAGMSGNYRDRTGETGTWSWSGQFPD